MKKMTVTVPVPQVENTFDFKVDVIKWNNFVNAGAGKNKVGAIQNFLMTCCDGDDQKEKLRHAFNEHPSLETQLLERVADEFAPDLGLFAKKCETAQEQ